MRLALAGREVDGERAAFAATVLLAGATFWLVPRLPMSDLPQHAAQVALWHDLLTGASKWQPLLYLNYFTPYLVGEGAALALSFVLPVSAALKAVLFLAYLGFVASCMALRVRFGGDRRLDWLFVPGYFGYACALGLYTFLVAAPLGVLFMVLAHRYASRPSPAAGALLCLADVVLFFSHGLVFLFANTIGGLFLLLSVRSWPRLLPAALPYVGAGLLCVVYALVQMRGDTAFTVETYKSGWYWDLTRLDFVAFTTGGPVGRRFNADWAMGALVVLALGAPLALGARFNRSDRNAYVPLAITCLIWLAAPMAALNFGALYPRFAIFLLPAWAFVFTPPAAGRERRDLAGALWLPILCWAFLVVRCEQLIAFGKESETFEDVLAAAEPGARAVALIFDPLSPAAGDVVAYFHFPLWYQAEKGGLVDYNFAGTPAQIVRYRPDSLPATFLTPNWTWRRPEDLDWARDETTYRYYFVRSIRPLPDGFFPGGRCAPALVKSSGPWSLFENVSCHRG